MAYSDYGGYAYRNGMRVEARSDFTLTPDGKGFESPGIYPAFGAAIQGMSPEDIRKIMDYPSGHAVLGDGPIFVVLYKQSYLSFYRLFSRLDELDVLKTTDKDAVKSYEFEGKTTRYIDTDYFKNSDKPCVFEIDEHKVTVYWRAEDNHYQYVRLEQPDGTVWHGWSGYGVGAGLENCGYGYSTLDREDELWRLFERPVISETVVA